MENNKLLLPFCERYIEQQKNLTVRGTWKVLQTCRNHLKSFEIERKQLIDFDCITIDFLATWIQYLYTVHQHSKNYAAKMVECLKQFMNAASDEKLHQNSIHQSRRFAVKKMQVFDIALSNTEIETIANLDLTDLPKGYTLTRDYFVINCNIGLRYSDWDKITKQNILTINGKDFLNLTMLKTGRRVTIPLNTQVSTILKKYNGQLPKVTANQTCNRYLKEIAKAAGLTDELTKTISKAGNMKKITLAKYEMIGTHTARRSFATNAYLQGMDVMLIRNITGHQDEGEFFKYIKINGLQKSLMASKHEFFK